MMNTVCAYRSLLQEQDYQLKHIGVKKLLEYVSIHWTDIANDITLIQQLWQDNQFPDHKLLSLLLSKIYFYLNDYDQALNYAINSGQYFNINKQQDQFTDILVNKCIEKYIQINKRKKQNRNNKNNSNNNNNNNILQQKQQLYIKIVEKMIDNSLLKQDYKLPLGISLDTFDLQLFQKIIKSIQFHTLIQLILPHLTSIQYQFRKIILENIISYLPKNIYTIQQYINLLQLLWIKGDYDIVSKIIYQCIQKNQKQIAYTIALQVSQMHGFNKKVLDNFTTEKQFQSEKQILTNIIQGKFADQIHNIVLKNQAKTDPYYQCLLKKIQPKNSIAHSSAIMSLSMLQAFTQDDSFLKIKQNLQWVSKSTHWNKFTSIASLGLIFRNHKNKQVFNKFLPQNTSNDVVNHYPNGGALYGLGLLFTGTSNIEIIDYIISITTNPTHNQNQVIIHGACLGLGLTSFASGNQNIGQRLKDILNSSTSVMGQASALALGLTFAGTNNQAILSDLIAFAQDTQHQKIIRSICLSIGLISFQSPSIQFLNNLEINPILKMAVPLYLACAYFKTSNPIVVRKLLQLSNDISNEIKRTAIIALGFVMYHDEKLINVIKMLMYSYNAFIRYGCIMALAIGSKETKDSVELIWPLLSDPVDHVRQCAYISLAILFQVTTVNSEPKLAEFRKKIQEILNKTHCEIMVKMGAILSIGILDIGGRNMNISLTTRSGMPKIEAITGMLIFSQYWNWFPYLNFIGLAISPSIFIGVKTDFNIPKSFQLKSNCKPSFYDYPLNIVKQQKKNDNKKQFIKELSTTIKTKARAANKKKQNQMQIQISSSSIIKKPSLISSKQQQQIIQKKQKLNQIQQKTQLLQKKQEQQTFSILNNPTRIVEKQKKIVSFIQGRYIPILQERKIGISFLKDTQPNQNDIYLNQNKIQKQEQQLEKIVEEKLENDINKDDQMAPPQQFDYDQNDPLIKEKKQ